MNKPRQPELEESECPLSAQAIDLEKQLETGKTKLNKGYKDSIPVNPINDNLLRVLIVDDNNIFLESIKDKKIAKELNLVITTLQPTKRNDVRNLILKNFDEEKTFDCVLLDYAYKKVNYKDSSNYIDLNIDFNGLQILSTLRTNIKSTNTKKNDDNEITLRYLPVAIVTHDGSEEQITNRFDPDTLLGAGADKVYSEKGLNLEVTQSQKDEPHLSSKSLLTYLNTVGYKEMRSRAWARMWQDLRHLLEDKIKSQLDDNNWLKNEGIEEALETVWDTLAQIIIQAGYASHVSMRTLGYIKKTKSWELKKVGSTDKQNCPKNILWDALPLLETCLIEESQSIHTKEALSENDLFKNQNKDDKELQSFRRYIGCRAMAARLDSKISPVGTFLMTRDKNAPPFSEEDKTLLRITVERIGLFYRELHLRKRNHKRQMALLRLGRELMDAEDENIIVAKAIKTLHLHLHRLRNIFRKDNNNNDPTTFGRVSIRLIEPGTGRLMRPDHALNIPQFQAPRWALGFDTNDASPNMITIDSDSRYKNVIEKTEPLFLSQPDSTEIEERRKDKTHAKMLAPIMAGSIVVGTVNIEHQDSRFYGKEENASADFALLKAVALEVGQALRALRARRMLRKLLQLHMSTGEKGKDQVIADLMGILYDYTGCSVGMWLEPNYKNWKISAVWECPQGYKDKVAPSQFRNDHKKKSWRFEQWRKHIEGNFKRTLVSEVIEDNKEDIVYYREEGFLSDESMAITTRSQAVLILRDPNTKNILGAFSFLYNQKPGLDLAKQKYLLEDAANFAASYLSIHKKNIASSQIMQQHADLGYAYQQLRHSLKLQLGGINGAMDRLLDNLEDNQINVINTNSIAKEIKGFLSNISQNIELSKAMIKPATLQAVNIQDVWDKVRNYFLALPDSLSYVIEPMSEPVWVSADSEIIELVFQNLFNNAIEAMVTCPAPHKLSCILLGEGEQGFKNIAIRDTGLGINTEIAEHLFDQIGISTKATGTGFGTFFSAYLLKRSGANIRYDHEYRKGAQFILSFPKTQPTSQ